MTIVRHSRGAAFAGLIAALALMPAAGHSEEVGAAAAVKPSSTGTPPGMATRDLKIGTNILSRERIRTTQSGSLQVMFLDKTTLTIGPSSDLVIDEFVYKAGASTGRFSASLTKGALRFVGGQISHTAGATITTPAATIGIRGGAAFITHDAVCQANRDKARSRHQCTKVVCTGGLCKVTDQKGARTVQLKINQAVEIDSLSVAQPFNVQSVTLNDVAKGGDGAIVPGQTGSSGETTFSGQSTITQTVQQAPEPLPPP
jgi:hypothetical protein